MSEYDALDDFAGPGGWDEGARMVGLRTIGVEWDEMACRTAVTAGHERIRADVAAYPSHPFVGIPGYIASPPCQAWSLAGKGLGKLDRANCYALASRMAEGDDSTDWCDWEDPRSPLVCQPVRRVRDLRPEWVALEEVPQVFGLYSQFARIFRGWGYSTWVGVLCAADYGVPQTRDRCVVMASRVAAVSPPVPTHSPDGDEGDLFGGRRSRWVSMADALGWDEGDVIRPARGAGMIERHGDRPDHPATGPAPTVISKSRSWIRGNQRTSTTGKYYQRRATEPAPTLTGVAAKGTGVKVSVEEAAVMQSFPRDYPWSGGRSKQFEQVGNAVPPLLAAHILAALTGAQMEAAA
jgi:DNA (cytosine-5)-methyltransferase 1